MRSGGQPILMRDPTSRSEELIVLPVKSSDSPEAVDMLWQKCSQLRSPTKRARTFRVLSETVSYRLVEYPQSLSKVLSDMCSRMVNSIPAESLTKSPCVVSEKSIDFSTCCLSSVIWGISAFMFMMRKNNHYL